MPYLVAGIIIGLGVYHLALTKHVHKLTKQIAHLRQYQLQRDLSGLSSNSPLNPLLTELAILTNTQKENIIQLQRHKTHLKADLMNISHDLRTPLTAIYGYLQLLNDTQLSTQERTHYLETATRRTESLEKLIQDLFYLGKLEAHTVSYHHTSLRVDLILTEQIVSLYQSFEDAGIHVEIAITTQTTLVSDQAAIERIFNNLLLNAIQHGTTSLSITHCLDANQRCFTRFCNLLKSNTKLDIEQVFQRHYTGTAHRNQNNSGLGLAICAELCQQLNHTISAHIEDNHFVVKIYW